MEAAFQEVQEQLHAEVLALVLLLSPSLFERLIVDLLVAMGYGGSRADAGKAIGRSGDGGIDGLIRQDPLGLDIVYMQAKRYQPENTVGRPEIQAFSGSLDGVGATRGVFVTTSSFSAQARQYAERVSKRIILVDGDSLAQLLILHNVGVRTADAYEVKKIDEEFFSEE
ncbi:MAG: restriction endonuclease [Rhodospirillales bacterium]|nr:restriction endonuclease [Rhodospirillales bacterium]